MTIKKNTHVRKQSSYHELLHVPLEVDVGQVRHHVRDDLEACVLCLLEALASGPDGVAAVGVPGHVLVDGLHSDLQAGAAICQHVAQVALQAVVGTGLDGDAYALCVAPLGVPERRESEN